MFKMINYRKLHRDWQLKYDANAPKSGDIAPDFELYDTNNQNSIRLSEFRGKRPVVLIFGSFT